MNVAVIGYTGLVGSTICRQTAVESRYRSTNIAEIRRRSFNTVICAGAPAVKWKANQEPEADLANIRGLMSHLETIRTERFVLISTVDVYKAPVGVDEATPIETEGLDPYGKHRYLLEEFAVAHFPRIHVIRLPALFGEGLKKNFVYDLLTQNALHLTHTDSSFQFYDLRNLWKDVQIVTTASLPLINLAVEPVRAGDIARECFEIEFHNDNGKMPVRYDMQSRFAALFQGRGAYMYSSSDTLRGISEFAHRKRLAVQ